MKRLCLFYLFFQFALPAYSDWELFPLNQKSYYQFTELYWLEESINFIAFDTIIYRSDYQAAYQNRKYSGNGVEQCYSEITNPNYPLQGTGWMSREIDSLIFVGDTVRYSQEIYFLPRIAIGDSWRTSGSLYNGFTDIEFTCTSITLQSFLGITDSVKEFTLSTYNGTSLVTSSLTGYVIKLSKNHGLIEYLDFFYLKGNDAESHRLVGFRDSTGIFGFQAPVYLDFFPYKPGDIMNWHHYAQNGSPSLYTNVYYRDSIIGVSITTDSLKFSYVRQAFDSISGIYSVHTSEVKYSVKYFKSLVECPPHWISINPASYSSSCTITYSDNYVINTDSSISYYRVYDGTRIDTIDCSLSNSPNSLSHIIYNTRFGITESCNDAFYYNCAKLIGSYMHGVLHGDTNFVTGIENVLSENQIKVYPNPAQESFFLEVNNPVGTYTLFSAQGQVCKKAKVSQLKTEISIEDLSKGIYFLKYINENNSQSVKRIIRM